MLLRLPYLALSSVFALVRLLPMRDSEKDIEILALRHQLAVLKRQVDQPRLTGSDRASMAALLHRLPRVRLRQLQLIVSPDTVLRWHRDLIRRRHASISRKRPPGRPPTVGACRLWSRLARENTAWGYRRIHGELAVLGIKVAPSTVWEILNKYGIAPAPDRPHTTWAGFLRSQAEAIVACDFLTATTLTGATHYVFAVTASTTASRSASLPPRKPPSSRYPGSCPSMARTSAAQTGSGRRDESSSSSTSAPPKPTASRGSSRRS